MIRTHIKNWCAKYIFYIVAGVCIGAGVAFTNAWWLSFVGVMLLIHLVTNESSFRHAALGSMYAGILKGGLASLWMLSIYPITWLGDIPAWHQHLFIVAVWLSIAVTLGIPSFCIGWCGNLVRAQSWYIRAICFPFIFLAADLGGALLFSLYTNGPGSDLSVHFGFGMFGYSLAHHGMLRTLAVYGGVIALSIALVLLASLCVSILSATAQKKRGAVACALLIGFVETAFINPLTYTSAKPSIIAAVGTTFHARARVPDYELFLRQYELMQGVETALGAGAEVVLLPEDARLGYNNPGIITNLQMIPRKNAAIVVDSYRTDISSTSVVLRSYAHDLNATTTYTNEKGYLVPLGEFVPYLHTYILRMFGGMQFFKETHYVRGMHDFSQEAPTHIPHVLFCFEQVSPSIAKDKSRSRIANIMAHPISHAWFHTPHTLWNQEQSMLIVQSIYSGLPILQAGNMAPSVLYTPDGNVHKGNMVEVTSRVKTYLFSI